MLSLFCGTGHFCFYQQNFMYSLCTKGLQRQKKKTKKTEQLLTEYKYVTTTLQDRVNCPPLHC